MAARNYGQYCGVVSALELVGERWALLIVRDLLVGPRRYTDLKAGLPRIPTNILSTRLKELQEGGVIRRAPLLRSIVYELTDIGRGLEDIVLALDRWGFQALGDPADDDIVTADSLTITLRSAFQVEAADTLPPTVYVARFDTVALVIEVAPSSLAVRPHDQNAPIADLQFATGMDFRRILGGELSASNWISEGTVQIEAGDPALLDRFASTFTLARQAVAF